MDDNDLPQSWAPTTDPGSPTASEPQPGHRFRRNVVAVGAALGLTLGGIGIAAAQTDSTTSTTAAPAAPAPPAAGAKPDHGPGRGGPGAGLTAAAKAIGISEADLQTALRSGQSMAQVAQSKSIDPAVVITALVEEAKAKLAEDVKAGRLTQAQADERTATLQARITEHVNKVGGAGKGSGKRGHGGPGLAAAAKAIGISEADLQTALRSGQSIAQVAQAKGVDPAVVITAMVEEAKAKLAEKAANLQPRITEQVNRTGGGGPRRP